VAAIARFVAQLDGLEKSICLLPYHTLGRAKYKSLGRVYAWDGYERLSDEHVQHLAQVVASFGLAVRVGG
jgi:pyruvate formate lyase activating enzyme